MLEGPERSSPFPFWERIVTSNSIRFCFDLDPVADIEPWGEPGRAKLHWFGLTSGRYWIETPRGEVLSYTPEVQRLWNFPHAHVDYQVARMFEDLQEHLPAALEPVPNDVAIFATTKQWLARLRSWVEDDSSDKVGLDRWELYEAAMSWFWEREIDTAHLSYGPRISIWRMGDEVHFRWCTDENRDRGVTVFTVPDGEYSMDALSFEAAAYDFGHRLLGEMRNRVEGIRVAGWKRSDCTVDLDVLVADQENRERLFRQGKPRAHQTNWDEVRRHLAILKEQVGFA